VAPRSPRRRVLRPPRGCPGVPAPP
jgi:hypothetical protein